MRLNSKKIMPVVVLSSCLALSGCSNAKNYLPNDESIEMATYISSQTSNPDVDFKEVQSKISENISRIEDKTLTSDILNNYVYILYNEASDYISYLNIIGDDLNSIKKNLDIDKLDVSMHKKVGEESKIAGAVLEEMDEKDLMIIDEDGSYFVEVNMNKLLEKYGAYLDSDVVEFMKFRAMENEKSAYNANSDKYDLEALIERASISIDNAHSKKESSQLHNWVSSADYYYRAIMNDYANQHLSDDGSTVSPEYFSSVKSSLEKYKDSNISKDMLKYINILERNNGKIDATEVNDCQTEILEAIQALVSNK